MSDDESPRLPDRGSDDTFDGQDKPRMTIEELQEMLAPDTPGEAVQFALAYASMGWHVIPLKAKLKEPLVRWKAGATTDPVIIHDWWERWPAAGVAIVMGLSNLVVVDVDEPGAEAKLDLPETLTASTGRGKHFYYAAPEGVALKGHSGDGYDVKASTGYVVAPPSIHPSGARYKWVSPQGTRPAAAPAWIVERPKRKPKAEAEASALSDLLNHPTEKSHVWLAAVAGHYALLFRDSESDYLVHVQSANDRLSSPLEPAEAARVAESIWRAEVEKQAPERAPGVLVTTAIALTEVEGFLRRFIVFASDAQVVAVSLWVAHSHAIEAAAQSPYLAITSAEKQSGKSRLFEVLETLVARPWRVETPTEAVMFRKIDRDAPTILFDEIDAVFGKGKEADRHEGLRALINAGNRRGSTIPRCVGPKMDLKDFAVFCPKALAGIGSLPDTVADRAIPIRLARRRPGERVERFRLRMVAEHAESLRAKLETWGDAKVENLVDADPDLPDELGDRQQDSWEPLLAIADLAASGWPERARRAAIDLHGAIPLEESAGILLLRHLREAFGESDRLSTAELLRALVARDDGPWPGWWANEVENGKTRGPAARMAKMLKPFEIHSKTLRFPANDNLAKGYEKADFEDSWGRYLLPPKKDVTTLQSRSEHVLGSDDLEAKSASDQGGYDVTTFLGGIGEKDVTEPVSGDDDTPSPADFDAWLLSLPPPE